MDLSHLCNFFLDFKLMLKYFSTIILHFATNLMQLYILHALRLYILERNCEEFFKKKAL